MSVAEVNQSVTDEYLIDDYRAGRAESFNILLKRYHPLIKKISTYYYAKGLEKGDLYQEGCIGLLLAVRSYNVNKGTFNKFANEVIRRYVINVVKKAHRLKHRALNSSLTFRYRSNESMERVQLLDLITDPSPGPELILMGKAERVENIKLIQMGFSTLTELEKSVFLKITIGVSYKVASQQLGVTTKSIDNAYIRAKKKLKRNNNSLLKTGSCGPCDVFLR